MQTTAILRVLGLLLLTEGCTSRTSSDEIAQVKAKTNVVTPKQKVAPKEKATSNFDSQQTNSIPAVGTQYILGDGPSGIELVELKMHAVVNRFPLGLSVVFGSDSPYFSTLTSTTSGLKFQVYNGITHAFSKSDVWQEPGVLMPITGLAQWLTIDSAAENIFYVTMEQVGNHVAFVLNVRDIVKGGTRKFPIPASLFSPRVVALGDRIGVYNETGEGFAFFSVESGKFQFLVPGMAESDLLAHQAGMDSSKYLLAPGVGLVRVSKQGSVERITNSSLEVVAETKLYWLNENVIDPQIASFEGHAVLVFGVSATGKDTFSEIVLFDPLANTELTRKRIQLEATTFYVARNCSYFLIMPKDENRLMVIGANGSIAYPVADLPPDLAFPYAIVGPLETEKP